MRCFSCVALMLALGVTAVGYATETKTTVAKSASTKTVAAKSGAHDGAEEVTLDEMKAFVNAQAEPKTVLIDANTEKMFKDGHIPGAISYAAHKKDLAKMLPEDKSTSIVAYCGGTMCTAWKAAADDLKKLGYKNIKHFKGGIAGWKEAGQPVTKG